jgi:hypothetical protein
VRVRKTYGRVSVALHVINLCIRMVEGTRWRSWLRNCATSRKVAVPIPDGVIGIIDIIRPQYGPGVDSAS